MRANSDTLKFQSKNVLLLTKSECIRVYGKVAKQITITFKKRLFHVLGDLLGHIGYMEGRLHPIISTMKING